ncbi:MAG: FAD-dependent oxidoreductase, partial [Candidatus Omnitrophica bacterium]|nr:FAD-dependent oxidoreductase [Candidatus Omnitrophota bacterium]
KTALMERSTIGGTCLNCGCIPTKTFIQSAKAYLQVKKSRVFGITIPADPEINFSEIQARKTKIIQQLKNGMESMLRGVDILHGEAVIAGPQEVDLYGEKIPTRSILIASGSIPSELNNLRFDGKKIISSNELLLLSNLPESLLIVGGGVIGCEFASLFAAMGVHVTVAECAPRILPGMDSDVSRKLENCFRKRGIQTITGADISTLDLDSFSYVAVCVGRKPYLEGLQLERNGVKTTASGSIVVDDFLRTSVPGIFAAGDCASKIMVAHFAW